MVTNNIIAESHLSVFGSRAVVAKSRNYKFKGKTLKSDMVLHKSSFENIPDYIIKKISGILNQRETKWDEQQKKLHRLKIEEKIKKAKNLSQYTNKLLQQCKTWKGPVSSMDELNSILKEKPDKIEQIVRTELAYYRNTHKSDVITSPSLFKLNKISHEERFTNFCVLLGGISNEKSIVLPQNEDALSVLRDYNNNDNFVGEDEEIAVEINQLCVTLWNGEHEKLWYLGYCKEVKDNGEFLIEHLDRIDMNSNLKWKYPQYDDICLVEAEQILEIDIQGEWDVVHDRNMTFTLQNHEIIHKKFLEVQ